MQDKEVDLEGASSAVALHALIGKLAHDLVGPLGTQLGFLELLAQSCTGEQETKYLERITRQSKKLLELVSSWRDGIGDASEAHRQPVTPESVSRWLGCEVQSTTSELVPMPLVHASRLCLLWWAESAATEGAQATLTAHEEQVSIELALPGLREGPVTESWQPDESVASWYLYVARMIIGRAHGRMSSDVEGDGCRLTLSVPV